MFVSKVYVFARLLQYYSVIGFILEKMANEMAKLFFTYIAPTLAEYIQSNIGDIFYVDIGNVAQELANIYQIGKT